MNLVYIELVDGKIKKSSFEAVNYAHKLGEEVTAIAIGLADDEVLAEAGKHGAKKVIHVKQTEFENNLYASIIAMAAKELDAKNIIISNTYTGKSIAPRVAIK